MGHFRHSEFYDDIFSRYEKYWKNWKLTEYRYLWELAYLFLSELGDLKVLEIGCGTGQMGSMLTERGVAYQGFDYSKVAIKMAKERFKLKNVWVGDAREVEPYDRHYHVAMCMEILEHTDDLEIIKNIGSGKYIIASVPDFDDRAHIRHFKTLEEVRERYNDVIEIERIVKLDCWYLFRGKIK